MSKSEIEAFSESLNAVPGTNTRIKLSTDFTVPAPVEPQPAKAKVVAVPPFNELAKQLDPMMPKADYDMLREKYFRDHVVPNATNSLAIPAMWEEFLKGTERPALQDDQGKTLTQLQLSISHAAKSMLAPAHDMLEAQAALTGAVNPLPEIDKNITNLEAIAHREGYSTAAPTIAGELIGSLPPLLLAEGAVGPLATKLAAQAFTSAKTIKLANLALKGGMGFAAYETAAAEGDPGQRMMAGVRGFVAGAGPLGPLADAAISKAMGEEPHMAVPLAFAALGLPGYIRAIKGARTAAEASELASDVMAGKTVPQATDELVVKKMDADTAAVKREGRPSLYLDLDAKQRGTFIIAKDRVGKPVPIPVHASSMEDSFKKINFLLDNGGAIDSVQAHASDTETAIKVIREIADKRGYGYDNSIILETQAKAEAIRSSELRVAKAKEQGIPLKRNDYGLIIDEPLWGPETTQAEASKLIEEHIEGLKLSYAKAGTSRAKLDVKKLRTDLLETFKRTNPQLVDQLADAGVPATQLADGRVSVPTVEIQVPPVPKPEWVPKMDRIPGDRNSGQIPLWTADMPTDQVAKNIEEYIVRAGRSSPGRALETKVAASMREDLWKRYGESSGKVNQELDIAQAIGDKAKVEGQAPKMTYAQATDLVKRMGKDPATADIDAIMHLGEEEIQRLEDVVAKQKETATGPSASTLQEDARLGKFGEQRKHVTIEELHQWAGGAKPRKADPNAPDLVRMLGHDPETHSLASIKLEQGDGYIKAIVPRSMQEWFHKYTGLSDFNGLTQNNWQGLLRELGVPESEIAKLNFPNSPMVIFKEGVGPQTIFHEELHTGFVNAELNPMLQVSKEHRGTITGIANGLQSEQGGYTRESFQSLVDEAFTFASQAIRFNNEPLLETLANWDGSAAQVRMFVHDTAQNMLEATTSKLDNPGVRNLQVKLKDLIRRSSDTPFADSIDALGPEGLMLGYEPGAGWIIPTKEGLRGFPSLNEAWDHILATDISHYTSDPSFSLQTRGMRGPFTAGPPPGKRLPMPDFPLGKDTPGIGWTSINGWFRPFLGWTATLDRQANKIWEAKGMRLPIFSKVKAVDNAERLSEPFVAKWKTAFAKELKNFDHKKQVTLFELLAQRDAAWPEVQHKFKLTDAEMESARRLVTALDGFSKETSIMAREYLTKYYTRLKAGEWTVDSVPGWTGDAKSAGFFNKAVLEGVLDPSDNHAGRFLGWLVTQGKNKMYMDKPLQELQKLVDFKTPEGAYALGPTRYPLTNYLNHMKGVPDTTARALTTGMAHFMGAITKRFEQANKFLPEGMKLPTDLGLPSTAMNRLILFSYAGGLAARPAVALRDMLQVLITGLPTIGPSAFGKGVNKAMTREGWLFAEQSGALLRKTSVAELYGDIFNEMPLASKSVMEHATRIAQKTLGLSRMGNNLARTIVFNGAYDDAINAVNLYRAGKLTSEEFLHNSHAWNLEQQIYTKILGDATKSSKAAHDIAKEIALEVTDASQWAYRKGTQPAMLKTGLGRILGQYGSWPLNYGEFLVGHARKYSTFPKQTIQAGVTWGAVNFAASWAMEQIGADSSKWLWTSPSSYTGGPQLDLVRDIAQGFGTDDQAASARARIMRYPLNFIPGIVAGRSIATAIENNEDFSIGGKGFIRAMGFKPLEEVNKDPDYLEWVLEESGATADPSKGRR